MLDKGLINKYDAPICKLLCEKKNLTPAQEFALANIIKRYSEQLKESGIKLKEGKSPKSTMVRKKAPIIQIPKFDVMYDSAIKRLIIKVNAGSKERFDEMIGVIKHLPGREYVAAEKRWTVPRTLYSIEKLKSNSFRISEDVEKWTEKEVSLPSPSITGKFLERLYPFQREGVMEIERRDGVALLADEMGLGKTVQALTWLRVRKEIRPAVLVVPASLKVLWKNHISEWLPKEKKTTVLLRGGKKSHLSKIKKASIIIVNYDILAKHAKDILSISPKVIVFDECHMIKNPKAKRTVALSAVASRITHKIAISGTPAVNRPSEFFTTLNVLHPELWPSYFRFVNRYMVAKKSAFGQSYTGAANTLELHEMLTKTVMVRRLKKDVLQDLPDKIRAVVPVEITNRATYDEANNDLIRWLFENNGKEEASRAMRAEALVRFEKLKQLSLEGKIESVYEWVDNFLETEKKLVIITTHHSAVDRIVQHYGDLSVKMDGRDSAEGKEEAERLFQNDESVKIIVCNIKLAQGRTFTAASDVLFVELGWTPGEHDQAEDRVHRIGQESSKVNAWYIVGVNTIEEHIARLLDIKRKNLTAILNGEEAEESSILIALLDKYLAGEIVVPSRNPKAKKAAK